MIVLDCAQGSEEWLRARVGIPTASQFHRILTPKTGKLSTASDTYAYELLAEEMLGHSIDEGSSDFMTRGTSMESRAVEYYEFRRDARTERVGFILRDDRLAGCSPDRLVGGDGGLEIKCPSAAAHVSYMLGSDSDKYKCQVQGALWLTGRRWWDWLSFNPEMPPVLVRFVRDEAFIAKLAGAVDQFIAYLDECRDRLVTDGYMAEKGNARERIRQRELGVRLDALVGHLNGAKTAEEFDARIGTDHATALLAELDPTARDLARSITSEIRYNLAEREGMQS